MLSSQLKVGLQTKSILVLSAVVITVAGSGAWFYYESTRNAFQMKDLSYSLNFGESLSLVVSEPLEQGDTERLQSLLNSFIESDSVGFIAVLDASGKTVASAARGVSPEAWSELLKLPVSYYEMSRVDSNRIVLAQPIQFSSSDHTTKLIGSIRVVFDSPQTARMLLTVRRRMMNIACAIIVCAIPLGYLLVWRVLVQPIHQLARAAQRLAIGDFSARSGLKRHDEIGELAQALDYSIGEVANMRTRLVCAKESLEKKVMERTEQIRQANFRLVEEMNEREEFLRAVSHDLNAPIRNIAGLVTLILMKWKDELPEEVLARMERIRANADNESALIAELLELSRIRSQPQKRSLVDIGSLLREVGNSFEYELQTRNIALKIESGMPSLFVEPNRLRQVFQNLIDNAIKYMDRPSDGWIEVSYSLNDGYHRFAVSDNGPGISPDQHPRIFQVFRRAENSATMRTEGKGVGLAVVKSVMSNYGGQAWVESQIGRGATFFVTLEVNNIKNPTEHREVAHERVSSDIAG
jgi:signal transduction histidine kinase